MNFAVRIEKEVERIQNCKTAFFLMLQQSSLFFGFSFLFFSSSDSKTWEERKKKTNQTVLIDCCSTTKSYRQFLLWPPHRLSIPYRTTLTDNTVLLYWSRCCTNTCNGQTCFNVAYILFMWFAKFYIVTKYCTFNDSVWK